MSFTKRRVSCFPIIATGGSTMKIEQITWMGEAAGVLYMWVLNPHFTTALTPSHRETTPSSPKSPSFLKACWMMDLTRNRLLPSESISISSERRSSQALMKVCVCLCVCVCVCVCGGGLQGTLTHLPQPSHLVSHLDNHYSSLARQIHGRRFPGKREGEPRSLLLVFILCEFGVCELRPICSFFLYGIGEQEMCIPFPAAKMFYPMHAFTSILF